MSRLGVETAVLTKTPVIEINFRKLWNCCWGNEQYVIVMFDDDGAESRHAVCRGCAFAYTGEVELLPTDYNKVPSVPNYPVRPMSLDRDFITVLDGDPETVSGDVPGEVLYEGDCHLAFRDLVPGVYVGRMKSGATVALMVQSDKSWNGGEG